MPEPTCETWRPIPSFTGYEASSLGRIRSIDRIVVMCNGRRRPTPGHVLTPQPDTDGYLFVHLSVGGHVTRRSVHGLVAETWIGARPLGLVVCHGLGGMLDNAPTNLRYDTQSANIIDTVQAGTHSQTSRAHCPREHPLAGHNLTDGAVRRGWRTCKACARAHAVAGRLRRTGVEVTPELFRKIADDKFAEIVAA